MAQELSKVKKEVAPVIRKPDDPAAKYRTKAEQLEVNKRNKKAAEIGEQARLKALKEFSEPVVSEELSKAKVDLVQQKQLLATCVEKEKELQAELAETAPGEQRPVKMQIGKLKAKIEKVEGNIAEIEEEIDKLK